MSSLSIVRQCCHGFSAVRASAVLTTAMAIGLLLSNSANAGEREYFQSVQGKWSGAGTIVAGPYKNTRFTCNFDGNAPKGTGMELTGKCRVGLFSQPMSAKISKKGSTYRGQFLDGASGKGLDIVSGRLRGQKLLLGIKRKQLNGTMVASLNGPDKLNITIAVRVNRKMIPFIGVTLKRTGSVKRASLASQ